MLIIIVFVTNDKILTNFDFNSFYYILSIILIMTFFVCYINILKSEQVKIYAISRKK